MGHGRPCNRPGCRAWAMKGREFCRSHQTVIDRALSSSHQEATPLEPSESQRRIDEALERQIATLLVRYDERPAASSASLADEINTLRLVLLRVLTAESDASRIATAVPRIVDSLIRVIRTERTIQGEQAQDLSSALTHVLMEFGPDERGDGK